MESLMRAWAAFVAGDPQRAICETQYGTGDHRLLCFLITSLVEHHGDALENWKDIPQTFFDGQTPRNALRLDDPQTWIRLSKALNREANHKTRRLHAETTRS